ncbi:hypothetical protein Fmac_010673 [Flemingia macrophylla]|uniref:Uncharacterized protein n=1 Tax=Flemingia macrophylla TaxID=520843 RepID=A0ABD1ML03_9FABA
MGLGDNPSTWHANPLLKWVFHSLTWTDETVDSSRSLTPSLPIVASTSSQSPPNFSPRFYKNLSRAAAGAPALALGHQIALIRCRGGSGFGAGAPNLLSRCRWGDTLGVGAPTSFSPSTVGADFPISRPNFVNIRDSSCATPCLTSTIRDSSCATPRLTYTLSLSITVLRRTVVLGRLGFVGFRLQRLKRKTSTWLGKWFLHPYLPRLFTSMAKTETIHNDLLVTKQQRNNDAYGPFPQGELVLPLEAYDSPSNAITIIQQRSPVIKGMMVEFAKNMAGFLAGSGKKHIIVLSSLDFGKWQKVDMSRFITFLVPTSNGADEKREQLGWKKLREYDHSQKHWKYLSDLVEGNATRKILFL